MNPKCALTMFAALLLAPPTTLHPAESANSPIHDQPVAFSSLLTEMTDPYSAARLPAPAYESLQASSYNRASVHRDQPGWFADSDGLGFIRTEEIAGRMEWVLMEHDGPGCITKMWTPFFYYKFNDRKGPNVRIYLDGEATPVVDECFIELLTGRSFLKPPFGVLTARAGDSYLPIPFAKSCKVTLTAKPFYHIINYRAYPRGTTVTSFRKEQLQSLSQEIEAAGKKLYEAAAIPAQPTATKTFSLTPGSATRIELPAGPAAVGWFSIRLTPGKSGDTSYLRSVVLTAQCDGEQTIWCPVGDFFCCADSIHPFHTWQRSVTADGTMTCRWPMPYRKFATLALENRGRRNVSAELRYGMISWRWDDRSMHFHANWRADELLPGTPFVDWNFIDIRGRGVFVGDAWTVLNPTRGWWGEGDEKIYVDGAWDKGFPTHFGTGAEDYYGWAGGVVPTRDDEFHEPFLANVRVGGVDGNRTRGFNICTRTRSLDAIPFTERLCFDMEASPGTGQRRPTDFLGYSAVTFWYARPGATHNRPPLPEAAARPIMSLTDIAAAANSFDVVFRYSPAHGLGPEKNVCRRDPSDVIRVGGLYYVWYSKVCREPGVYRYPSGYSATVWYATSPDGHTWTERGQALGKGGPGAWDEAGVYTPNILVAGDKYYLTYDGAAKDHSEASPCSEGLAVADSPDGPWQRLPGDPVNQPTSDPARFDSFRVCDACLIVRDGRCWWYYKGRGRGRTPAETMMGLAIADRPAGPYVKHEANPLIRSGHEVLVWPHGGGVAALVTQCGPEKDTLQYAPDGIHFEVRARVKDPPKAAGGYRPDAFTGATDARRLRWGVSMVGGPDPYLVRFDCLWPDKDPRETPR